MAVEGIVPAERIEKTIVVIRGHKVMLDSDLAICMALKRVSWCAI